MFLRNPKCLIGLGLANLRNPRYSLHVTIPRKRFGNACLQVIALLLVFAAISYAQQPENTSVESNAPTTMFSHSDAAPYWISAQDNIIGQWHASFYAKYSGPNSLRSGAESAVSNVFTLFTGYRTHNTEFFFDLESASGGGLSDALGLAGFVNVDVVRNPDLGGTPYVARAMVRQIIPLGSEQIEAQRTPLSLATEVPVRRLEIRAGKFGIADFFDVNGGASDSHFQFMNWTADNNGAYDYSADTRGYTFGVLTEFYDGSWAFRFAESLMPIVANGANLEWNLHRGRAENFELELHPGGAANSIRLLTFVNHANMGVYGDAIANYLAGKTPVPEIASHPWRTTIKYGFGANLEHDFLSGVRAFGRWGWNEGQHESFAYTEVDGTVELGADVAGNRWNRRNDKTGAVFISNGISSVHQRYLELGGRGFLLGDGSLNYGRETIEEMYYTAHLWRGLFGAFDLQHINNPGYNRDRGPVLAPGLRAHMEF